MTFVGHFGGAWRTVVDFCRSFGGPWGTMGDFFRSLGGSLGDSCGAVLKADSAGRILEAVECSC